MLAPAPLADAAAAADAAADAGGAALAADEAALVVDGAALGTQRHDVADVVRRHQEARLDPWLAVVLNTNLEKTLEYGLYPFVPGDTFKLYLAALALPGAWRLVERVKR